MFTHAHSQTDMTIRYGDRTRLRPGSRTVPAGILKQHLVEWDVCGDGWEQEQECEAQECG